MDNWHFFLIAITVDGILIPLAWKLFSTLNAIKENNSDITQALTSLCDSISNLTKQMSDTVVRDVELKKDLEAVRQELRDHIKEERLKP